MKHTELFHDVPQVQERGHCYSFIYSSIFQHRISLRVSRTVKTGLWQIVLASFYYLPKLSHELSKLRRGKSGEPC